MDRSDDGVRHVGRRTSARTGAIIDDHVGAVVIGCRPCFAGLVGDHSPLVFARSQGLPLNGFGALLLGGVAA